MIIIKFDELKEILRSVFLVCELSKYTLDFIIGHGEILSLKIICYYRKSQKLMDSFLDAPRVIKTDENFGIVKVNFATLNKLNKIHFAKINSIEVVTGFMASTNNSQVNTLGCGGCDYIAAGFFAQIISIKYYMEKSF
jgi:aspartokinase/homoserine dehydrogenase 1